MTEAMLEALGAERAAPGERPAPAVPDGEGEAKENPASRTAGEGEGGGEDGGSFDISPTGGSAPMPSPSGEGAPVRTLGRMRGGEAGETSPHPSAASREIGVCHLPLKGKAYPGGGITLKGEAGRAAEGVDPCGADREGSPARGGRERPAGDYRAHFEALCAQGEALRAEFADFDLDAALHDPAFLRLTAPGLGVGAREAWCALHPEALDARAARRAARDAGTLLARAAAQGTRRPREGGGYDAAALLRGDPGGLSRGERARLKESIRAAAARGEKIYP